MALSIRTAAGQIVCRLGDLNANLRQVDQLTRQAAPQGARLILFGEGALTGYRFDDQIKALAPTLTGPTVDHLKALAEACDIVIAVGTVLREDDCFRVSHLVVFPDGRIQVQHKHNLTPAERQHGIRPGEEDRLIFEIDGVRFGILICADTGIRDIYNKLAKINCQVLLAPTAGGSGRDHLRTPAELDDPAIEQAYLQDMEKVCFLGSGLTRCRRHRMASIAVNLAGDDGIANYHPGHSSIVDSYGAVQGLIPGEYVAEYLQPRLLVADIAVQQACTSADA